MPRPALVEISPTEQARMRAELRRARYGYLLVLHILLLCAAGRPLGTGDTFILEEACQSYWCY